MNSSNRKSFSDLSAPFGGQGAMPKPDLQKVPTFYHNYINQVQQEDLDAAMEAHLSNIIPALNSIPEDKWSYRYAEGKWSIKELVQHVLDTERIFNYRALCFARKETISLPGFDENKYAAASHAERRNKKELIEELEAVQKATRLLFASFDEEQLESEGTANNKSISVAANGFIIAGHALHYLRILQERYF